MDKIHHVVLRKTYNLSLSRLEIAQNIHALTNRNPPKSKRTPFLPQIWMFCLKTGKNWKKVQKTASARTNKHILPARSVPPGPPPVPRTVFWKGSICFASLFQRKTNPSDNCVFLEQNRFCVYCENSTAYRFKRLDSNLNSRNVSGLRSRTNLHLFFLK